MVKHGGSVTTKHKEYERQQQQKLNSTLLKTRRNPIHGFIVDIRKAPNGDYYYEVKIRADATPSNQFEQAAGEAVIINSDVWFPLAEDPSVIALLYGDKDLILDSRCRLEFTAASPSTGVIFIEFDPFRRKPRKGATEFQKKAFLYAAAGGGKLI